jgi:type I restriction enzyme S subunit
MSEKIPKGWKWVKLGEVGIVITGKTPSSKHPEDWGYDMQFVTPTDYKNYRKFAYDSERYLSNAGINKLKNKVLPENSVLVTCIGSDMGKVVINKLPVITNQQINSIIPNRNNIFPDFLYYVLVYNYETLRIFASNGTAVPILNKTDFENIEISTPPLPEQKAIAEVLSSIDDKIELLHRQNKTLEEMAMTLFRKWFIEPTKDGLPEGWEEVSLGNSELSKIIPSGIEKFEGFKTYLATGDVEGTLIKGGVEITYNNRPSRANMQPEKYSVWFAKKEGVRKLLMFDDYSNTDKYILSTGFTGLKTNELSHYYIWCFVLSEDFQDTKDSLVSGSVQPDIPNEAVLQIFIPRPPDEVLLSFNNKVKPLFTKIQFNTSQIQTLEKLRDTLLPKLMSGEVRVKVENNEIKG